MIPTAPAEDRARWFQPDSCQASALTKAGLQPRSRPPTLPRWCRAAGRPRSGCRPAAPRRSRPSRSPGRGAGRVGWLGAGGAATWLPWSVWLEVAMRLPHGRPPSNGRTGSGMGSMGQEPAAPPQEPAEVVFTTRQPMMRRSRCEARVPRPGPRGAVRITAGSTPRSGTVRSAPARWGSASSCPAERRPDRRRPRGSPRPSLPAPPSGCSPR
jgi:hypothetical protein